MIKKAIEKILYYRNRNYYNEKIEVQDYPNIKNDDYDDIITAPKPYTWKKWDKNDVIVPYNPWYDNDNDNDNIIDDTPIKQKAWDDWDLEPRKKKKKARKAKAKATPEPVPPVKEEVPKEVKPREEIPDAIKDITKDLF